ncbi:glycosyltransferase [Kribbella sp. NPDC004536]|uniref:glycosyltransferase n=1 Tax=Kribbella sp. NPDC004536 TaxID=3364106 RepID=UPI0036A5AF01
MELLRAAGIDAALWFRQPGYRPPWFSTTAPVVGGDQLEFGADDLLVVPELYLLPGVDPAPGVRKVIFNQNHFLTYWSWRETGDYPGWDPAPEVWAVSRESCDVLGRLHPDLPVHLIPNPVDTALFRPAPHRARRIAWMPRRRPLEATVLDRLLRNDPRTQPNPPRPPGPDPRPPGHEPRTPSADPRALGGQSGAGGVELAALAELTEVQVAEALGGTSVFVALGISEGFGLPVAEALAAGCLVVGYPAGGGEELFEAPGTWRIDDARPHLLADRALELVDVPPDAPIRTEARNWIRERYSDAVTSSALLTAVQSALARPGHRGTATHPIVWPDDPVASAERAAPWRPS